MRLVSRARGRKENQHRVEDRKDKLEFSDTSAFNSHHERVKTKLKSACTFVGTAHSFNQDDLHEVIATAALASSRPSTNFSFVQL